MQKKLSKFLRGFLTSLLMGVICLGLSVFGGCKEVLEDTKPSADEIYASVSPSVFFVCVDLGNGLVAGGSAFFIDNNGTAVTNFHVIEGAISATATLFDGQECEVTKVLGMDSDSDLVVIKVDVASSKPVKIGNSNLVKTGDKVYAIGYPEAFKVGIESSTFTDGIISKNSFTIGGSQYIQTNVDITHGNSGGVLLNDNGEAIGITTGQIDISGVDYMNLALPINNVSKIDKTEYDCSLQEFVNRSQKHTVKFFDYDKLYTTQSIFHGKCAREETISTPKTGYQFGGWSADRHGTQLFDFTTPIQKDIALYAVWQPNTYQVVFRCEEDGVTGATEKITATYGRSFKLPECGFAREGYLFAGWKYDGKLYQAGDRQFNLTDEQGKEVVFTAEWKEIVYYTVEFNNTMSGAEGSLPQNINAESGTSFRLPTATLKGKGFNLVGWEYNGKAYAFGESVSDLTETQNGEVVFNTRWERIVYPITFDYNLPKYYVNATTTVAYDSNLQLPEIYEGNNLGYDFEGWEYNGKLYKNDLVIENFYSPNSAETIVAKWTPHTYQLTYIYVKSDVEFETKTEQITYGTGYRLPVELDGFTKEGHKIVGWKHGETTFTAGAEFKPVKENNTQFELYAQMGPISFQYICLDIYGNEFIGYNSNEVKGTCHYGDDFTEKVNRYINLQGKRYLRFNGYMACSYKILDENKNVYTGDVRYICKNDGATVYILPDWQETYYNLRFENMDPTESQIEVITVKYTQVFTLESLSKPGFVFKGWQMGAITDSDDPIYPAGTELSRLAEGHMDKQATLPLITFHAVWEPNSYTIRYDGNGAQIGTMADQHAGANEKVNLAKNVFKKSGSIFGGWLWGDVVLEDEAALIYTPVNDGELVVLKAYWINPLAGQGTKSNPYLISSYQDLYKVHFMVESSTEAASAYYSLTCDVDCAENPLYAIGTASKPFKGVFLGKQHKILNARFKTKDGHSELGLFGYVKDGQISGVGIVNYQISATQGYICAPLVCDYRSSYALENCYADGEIVLSVNEEEGTVYAGGLVGNLRADIVNCRAGGEISFCYDLQLDYSKYYYVGGLISVYDRYATSSTSDLMAENCYADVDISITKISEQVCPSVYVGGFCGKAGPQTFNNCVAKGDLYSEINCHARMGRFVGMDHVTTYKNCCVSSESTVSLVWSEKQLPTGVKEQTEEKLCSITYLRANLLFYSWKEENGKILLSWE